MDDRRKKAEKKNDHAKILFGIKQYSNALQIFSDAINLCPEVSKYWGNRAACYFMLGKYNEAVFDSMKSTQLDSGYVKGYVRTMRCYIGLNDFNAAESALQKIENIDTNNETIKKEKNELLQHKEWDSTIKNEFNRGNFSEVLTYVDKYLEKYPGNVKSWLYKAECLFRLKDMEKFREVFGIISQYNLKKRFSLDETIKSFRFFNVDEQTTNNPKRNEAEQKNRHAKTLFEIKQYANALHFYSSAIDLVPKEAKYWGNRAACHIMLGNYSAAISDAKKSIELDETYTKGYIRVAYCCKYANNLPLAKSSLQSALSIEPDNKTVQMELNVIESMTACLVNINKNIEAKNYNNALKEIENYLSFFPKNKYFELKTAELYIALEEYSKAKQIVKNILKEDPQNENALYLKALLFYYEFDIQKSFPIVKKAMKSIPDHCRMTDLYKKSKQVHDVIKTININNPQEAYKLYTQAISIDVDNLITVKQLYLKKIELVSKCSYLSEQIVDDCTKFMNFFEFNLHVLKIRANCFMHLEDYVDARDDFEEVLKRENNMENERMFEKANKLAKTTEVNYHKILGVNPNASQEEIKKKYHEKIRLYHPDKNRSGDNREMMNRKAAKIIEAYKKLQETKQKE